VRPLEPILSARIERRQSFAGKRACFLRCPPRVSCLLLPKSEILNTQMHELENNDRYQDAKHPDTRTLETR
jgi:hypothetical protein